MGNGGHKTERGNETDSSSSFLSSSPILYHPPPPPIVGAKKPVSSSSDCVTVIFGGEWGGRRLPFKRGRDTGNKREGGGFVCGPVLFHVVSEFSSPVYFYFRVVGFANQNNSLITLHEKTFNSFSFSSSFLPLYDISPILFISWKLTSIWRNSSSGEVGYEARREITNDPEWDTSVWCISFYRQKGKEGCFLLYVWWNGEFLSDALFLSLSLSFLVLSKCVPWVNWFPPLPLPSLSPSYSKCMSPTWGIKSKWVFFFRLPLSSSFLSRLLSATRSNANWNRNKMKARKEKGRKIFNASVAE